MNLVRVLGLALVFLLLPSVSLAQADAERIERLDGLCRLWGVVKLFHPAMAEEPFAWDEALVDVIPVVQKATTPDEYRVAIRGLLSRLSDPITWTVEPATSPRADEHAGPPTLTWITSGESKVAVISARDWTVLAAGKSGEVLTPLFEQCGAAKALIIDLRRSSPAGDLAGDEEAKLVSKMFANEAAGLTGGTLAMQSIRARVHSGYVPQSGQTSGGYFSKFQTTDRPAIKSAATAASGKPLVILTNQTSRELVEPLAALQNSGAATVIHEGDPAYSSGFLYEMTLPMGVKARIRTREILNSDGTVGFSPDTTIHPDGKARDEAMEVAKEVAFGKPLPKVERPVAAKANRLKDKPYADMPYPTREYRLLALFRLWNVMNYFFPYQQHMDKPWDGVLREFIPRFEEAKDAAEYGLAIREMTARLQDSHVGATGGEAMTQSRDALGSFVPPLLVITVGGEPVVGKVLDEMLAKEGKVQPGDTIVRIDGKPVEEVRAVFAKYAAASTQQSLRQRLHPILLRGTKDSEVLVTIKAISGTERDVPLKRSVGLDDLQAGMTNEPLLAHPAHETFCVLPQGFGYFDLVNLTQPDVKDAFDAVKETPALIMDMRGYPKGTAWEICSRLTSKPMVMAKFSRPEWSDPAHPGSHTFDQPIQPNNSWKYNGRIVVLIDERAISQSEHSCLGFEEAAKGRITFIGSPTTGANGDVTNCVLPGGVSVRFSGHDVRHADGRPLQRIGIQPDIKVVPTVKGLLAGKDEVLEAAVEFLKKEEMKAH